MQRHIDPVLPGFTRRGKVYRRRIADGHQRLVFDAAWHPRYARLGVHLQPYGEVTFPPVVAIASQMRDDPPWAPAIDFSLAFGLEEFVQPWRRHLIVDDPNEVDEVIAFLAGRIRDRVAALFDDLSTVSGFVATLTSGRFHELRLTTVEWVRIAAAQVHLGDVGGALQTLSEHVDPESDRRAFEYVRSL